VFKKIEILHSIFEIRYSRHPVPATTSGETPLLRKKLPFRVFSVFRGLKKDSRLFGRFVIKKIPSILFYIFGGVFLKMACSADFAGQIKRRTEWCALRE
jgi:hypothetical protein